MIMRAWCKCWMCSLWSKRREVKRICSLYALVRVGSRMDQIKRKCLLYKAQTDWRNDIAWCNQNCTQNSFVAAVRRLALATSVYHLWSRRNKVIFQQKHCTPNQVLYTANSERCERSDSDVETSIEKSAKPWSVQGVQCDNLFLNS